MSVDNVNGYNAVTPNGSPYKKTRKGKIILGTMGAIGMIPVPKSIADKLASKSKLMKDIFEKAGTVPMKKHLLKSGIAAVVLFSIGALIDKCVNKKRANKADVQSGNVILK